jgi:hypothetical protein
VVLKNTSGGFYPFVYRTVTLFGGPFQRPSTRMKLCNSVVDIGSTFSRLTTPVKLLTTPVWAFPRSFATTRGISVDFYSSGY